MSASIKWFLFFVAAALYGVIAIDPIQLKELLLFFIFQDRDMTRAADLLRGQWIFFGPEMTGGGNLPGPFYYYLLALPIALGLGWQGAFHLMVAVTALAAGLGALWIGRRANLATAWVWLILILTGIPSGRVLAMFMNVSFAIPFMMVASVLFWMAFNEDEKRRGSAFVLLGAVTGLAMQLHLSAIVFPLAAIVLHIGAERFGTVRLGARTWMHAGLALFITLSPFFAWWMAQKMGMPFGVPPPFVGSALYAPTSLFSMIGYATSRTGGRFAWNALCQMLETVPWTLLPVVAALYAAKENLDLRRLRPLLVCGAIGFIPFSYWFFVNIGLRYSGPFFVCLTLVAALLHFQLFRSERALKPYSIFAGALLVALSLGFGSLQGGMLFRDFPYVQLLLLAFPLALIFKHRRIFVACLLTLSLALMQYEVGQRAYLFNDTSPMPRAYHWKRIWRMILSRTGWTFEDAMSRIYFVNHHIEQDPKPMFEWVTAELKESPAPDRPTFDSDGLIVAFQGPEQTDRVHTSRWLLQQQIPQDLRDAILAREILLGPKANVVTAVIPYTVLRPNLLPKQFQNYGRGYVPAPADQKLKLLPVTQGAGVVGENSYLFKWNGCANQAPYCATGIFIEVRQARDTRDLHITILGAPLSQVSPWISPDWTEEWIRPYVEVDCGKKTTRFDLIGSVGYNRDNASEPSRRNVRANNSILAPLRREYGLDCVGRISEIRAGRAGSRIETIYRLEERPATELRLPLP